MMHWSRMRSEVIARACRMRGRGRALVRVLASSLRAPDRAALGTHCCNGSVKMRNDRYGAAPARWGRPVGCFLSMEATRGKTDLTADWLEKLGDCWREPDIDYFLVVVQKSIRSDVPVPEQTLRVAARAVEVAHVQAMTVCRKIRGDVDEVTSAVRAATTKGSGSFQGMPGVSDRVAEAMERLHRVGLLDALQCDDAVRYFRAKQAFADFSLITDGLNKLIEAEAANNAWQWEAKAARQAREKKAQDEALERGGLPLRYPSKRSWSQTWTPAMVENWCAEADAAGFRTTCGRTASEFLLSTCRMELRNMRFDPLAAARTVVEALGVLVQAQAVARGSDTKLAQSPVLCGAPGSQREDVLLSAVEAVLYTVTVACAQEKNNKLLVGAKGVGKTSIFQAIGAAMAILDYANDDLIICPAYVSKPSGVIPEAYMAEAMHQRGILTGPDGVLPSWCDPHSEKSAAGRSQDLKSWVRGWLADHGKWVVPVLLIDEAAEIRRISKEAEDRFIHHLGEMAEYNGPVVVRLTGTWSETANYFYKREDGPALHYHKIVKEQLQNVPPAVEAQLMCLFGSVGADASSSVSIARAIAKRMLEDDQQKILRKHGFLSPRPLLGEPEPAGSGSAVVITMKDAERWRDTDPDWREHAMQGEELVDVLLHSAAGIPRFLVRGARQGVTDMVADRLRRDLRDDPAFAHFAQWLLHQAVVQNRRRLGRDDEQLMLSGVTVHDKTVLKSMEGRDTSRNVSEFLDHYNERGHIVTETDATTNSPHRLVRFSSKLLLLIANAHLHHAMDELATVEYPGLLNASGAVGNDPMKGLVAEGLASNGLGMLGEAVGLEGRLGFRRLDCDAWLQAVMQVGPENQKKREEAGLDRLRLDSIAGREIPLNTVLKESPDAKKADLVAVCVADGSEEAVVIRAQVMLGRTRNRWLEAAKVLAGSWDGGIEPGDVSVKRRLMEASNLKHIKKWTHLPLWLSAVEPSDAKEIEEAGVKVVGGEAFWEMAIPAVRLAVSGLYQSAPTLEQWQEEKLRATMQRPAVYEASVRKRQNR